MPGSGAPPILRLKKDEDRRIRAGHLWVFSNEVDVRATPLVELVPGGPVEVHDARGNFLAHGYANPRSLIAVRILSRTREQPLGPDLLRRRIHRALGLREALFPGEPFYRLVFGEGDALPGLVVDRFGDVLVVQPTTAGVERLLETITEILAEVTGADAVLIRADSPARRNEGLDLYVREARGSVPDVVRIVENGVRFEVPVLGGQKTGWFFDHRLNRARLRRYVRECRVLDLFSYVGGWGVQAAAFGAREVLCVDSSAPALEGVARNAATNGVAGRVTAQLGDAFEVLQSIREAGERFDVIILDPPAFIKRKKDLREGEQAYRRLNRLALESLGPGGILVSASCSFHLPREALLRAVQWGAVRAGRDLQVLEEGHQGPDHPIHPAIPETSYLKSFLVRALD
jgi:23S rRNA (cytosine1962-C5)-methyltransferase